MLARHDPSRAAARSARGRRPSRRKPLPGFHHATEPGRSLSRPAGIGPPASRPGAERAKAGRRCRVAGASLPNAPPPRAGRAGAGAGRRRRAVVREEHVGLSSSAVGAQTRARPGRARTHRQGCALKHSRPADGSGAASEHSGPGPARTHGEWRPRAREASPHPLHAIDQGGSARRTAEANGSRFAASRPGPRRHRGAHRRGRAGPSRFRLPAAALPRKAPERLRRPRTQLPPAHHSALPLQWPALRCGPSRPWS